MLVLPLRLWRLPKRAPIMPGQAAGYLGQTEIQRLRATGVATGRVRRLHPDYCHLQAFCFGNGFHAHSLAGSQRIETGTGGFAMLLQAIGRIDPGQTNPQLTAIRHVDHQGVAIDDAGYMTLKGFGRRH